MKKCIIPLIASSILLSTQVNAVVIQEYSLFLNSPSLGTSSLLHSPIGFENDDFKSIGLEFTFTNSLNSEGYGNVSWEFLNNTGKTLSDVWVFGFLDAEIAEGSNSFFNEHGELISVLGNGKDDADPDSWEIDEPGYIFGDIYENLYVGLLDSTNNVGSGSEDDVSMALGFELGDLLDGSSWNVSLSTSLSDIGGLYHYDATSDTGFYYNGAVNIVSTAPPVVEVAEPSSLLLLVFGAFIFGAKRRRLNVSK